MANLESVRVGTCGWTDPTLIKARTFYPAGANTAEERLRYYASQFPIVEVDATSYALPRQEQAGLWVERTPPDFVFNVKAYSLLTHHPTMAKTVPADLRESILPEHRGKQRLYPNHLAAEASRKSGGASPRRYCHWIRPASSVPCFCSFRMARTQPSEQGVSPTREGEASRLPTVRGVPKPGVACDGAGS
jgi:Protein of unknown function DUF72